MRAKITFTFLLALTIWGCLPKSNEIATICSSTPLHFDQDAELRFWLKSDGLYFAAAALESCPRRYMRLNLSPLNDAARGSFYDQVRGAAVEDQSGGGYATFQVRALGRVVAGNDDDALPEIFLMEVYSLERAELPSIVRETFAPVILPSSSINGADKLTGE